MTRKPARLLAALLKREQGFGVIEGVIAAMLLALAAAAIYGTYDAGTAATYRAKQSQVELSVAQDQMEQMRARSYQKLALTSLPAHSTDPANPFNRVIGSSFNLSRTGTNMAPMIVNTPDDSSGTVDPYERVPTDNGFFVDVYRIVVWQSQAGCPPTACNGQDVKRVVIAVQLDTRAPAAGSRGYLELHSDFTDPDATSQLPADPGTTTNQQAFFLSDTSCNPNGPTVPGTPVSHPLHNTLGDCSFGTKTGNPPGGGAPDSLVLTPPDSTTDPWPDYQTDTTISGVSEKEGIQIDRWCQPNAQDPSKCDPNPANTSTCKWLADPSPQPQTRFHIWLSDEIPDGNPFDIEGPVTLSFYSRALSLNRFQGKLCFWLFERKQNAQGQGIGDILFGADTSTPSWTWSSAGNTPDDNWPNTYTPAGSASDAPPQALQSSADVGPHQVEPHRRLGLAVAVASDTPEPLAFMYDHSLFQAELDVATTSDPLGP